MVMRNTNVTATPYLQAPSSSSLLAISLLETYEQNPHRLIHGGAGKAVQAAPLGFTLSWACQRSKHLCTPAQHRGVSRAWDSIAFLSLKQVLYEGLALSSHVKHHIQGDEHRADSPVANSGAALEAGHHSHCEHHQRPVVTAGM